MTLNALPIMYRIIIITYLLFCPLFIGAQTVETNDEGERIVRFPDGSWRYYEPADSVYLPGNKEEGKLLETPQELNPELEAKIEGSKTQIQKVEKEIIRLMQRRVAINDQLLKIEDTKKKLDLNTELQKVIHQEKEQKRTYLDLKKELEELRQLAKNPNSEPKAEKPEKDMASDNKETSKSENKASREIPRIPEHIYHREVQCKVHQEKDAFSKRTKTQTSNVILFEYTPKVIRSSIDQKAFMTAYSSLFHIQGRYYLNVMIDITSERARQTYGYIPQGGQMMLQLVNGEVYSIKSTGNSIGTIMSSGGFTRYDVAYAVDYRILNELKKHPLDKIRLVWSTGYEDYQIYDVDVLKNQINCLETNL